MATTTPITHVPIDEYLNTEYEPDCDYVDGVLEDRNVGKQKHSETQILLGGWLLAQAGTHRKKPLSEQRVRLSASKVRIPDLCLIERNNRDEVVDTPPALWIEILSPEDRFSRVQRKVKEILNFGVPTVWIIDPYERQAWIGTTTTGIVEAKDNILRCEFLNLQLPLDEVIPAP